MASVRVYGGQELQARTLRISGFKHSLVPIMCASVLCKGTTELENTPDIEDRNRLTEILNILGAQTSDLNSTVSNCLRINTELLSQHKVPFEVSRRIHGAIYLLPTLLGRLGQVEMGVTGGCQIGDSSQQGKRPTSHMIQVLEQFGAVFEQSGDLIKGYSQGLKGCEIDIRKFSERSDILTGPMISGATKTAILAAMAAPNSTSIIHNPYRKPDVTELLEFAEKAGCHIERNNLKRLVIETPNELRAPKHVIISDLIEVVTFICASIFLEVPLKLQVPSLGKTLEGLREELNCFEKMNVRLEIGDDSIAVPLQKDLRPIKIDVTSEGIYSDSQPFFTLLCMLAEGRSEITEAVWKNRFDYAVMLNKLGADLEISEGRLYTSKGFFPLPGQIVHATDLRSAAVLILAALKIKGWTHISGTEHLVRGYSDFLGTLTSMGAKIEQEDAITAPLNC